MIVAPSTGRGAHARSGGLRSTGQTGPAVTVPVIVALPAGTVEPAPDEAGTGDDTGAGDDGTTGVDAAAEAEAAALGATEADALAIGDGAGDDDSDATVRPPLQLPSATSRTRQHARPMFATPR